MCGQVPGPRYAEPETRGGACVCPRTDGRGGRVAGRQGANRRRVGEGSGPGVGSCPRLMARAVLMAGIAVVCGAVGAADEAMRSGPGAGSCVMEDTELNGDANTELNGDAV